ncbi:hypothetical protein [Bacillus toyonensis]|uniref:hypothetical protein n=1 Tax=Bacillus toyonensis TaxID=155322 RepID=UPI0020D25B51|nr:hypothetical protein [Bacillus toyonensis]
MKNGNQSFSGWRPKINIKDVANAVTDVVETGKQIIDNTLNDIAYIFDNVRDCVETCGVSVDNIRLRVMHRGIQYISLVTP